MSIYERIAMLEGIAKTKRMELEVIEAEIKRLRDEDHKQFKAFKAELDKKTTHMEPVPRTSQNKVGGIRL